MADDSGRINQVFAETSFLYGANAAFVEDLYARYAADPASVDPSWQAFFATLHDKPEEAKAATLDPAWTPVIPARVRDDLTSALDGVWPAVEAKIGKAIEARQPAASPEAARSATLDSIRALHLIRAYRVRGHLAANLDPLGIAEKLDTSELDPANYGFSEADYDRPIFLDFVLGLESASLREILQIVRRTYCGPIGVQYMHISNPAEKAWLQERIEGREKEIAFTPEGKIAILKKLIEAETFERFLHKRFPGTKRFGLDGGEALVPAMEQIIKRGGQLGVREMVLGMPHRGRLNVLAAVMGKPYRVIFHEFQGGSSLPSDIEGSGDVKYHLGASSDREFDGNTVHLSLTANPSHLEIVNPVVLGKARAKQAFTLRENKGEGRGHVMPVLLHGDAAFAGQGVVAECFALSGLKGYSTGGTMHIIVNNQIGFTTSPRFSRSSPYPSDVALMVEAPILHVNGDDPEAVVFAAKVLTEFRQQFGKDVVLDMFCYRRFGHNEGDDPTFTQPLMYANIKARPSTREVYAQRLLSEGVITAEQLDGWIKEFEGFLDAQFEDAKSFKADKADWLDGKWAHVKTPGEDWTRGDTGVEPQKLKDIGLKLTSIPEGVDIHKTLRRVIDNRHETITTGKNIDWATAEHLALGALLDEGFNVRVSGQDSVRGTFSQRHAGLVDQTTEQVYIPLNNIRPGQAQLEIIDSLLSEEAVLGYEYGFSLADPNSLVCWEAQFGDFVNGAQVVIDQFISSGERKWLRMSGLVMLLPHGYEGQGPEHSSARLERFLQQCAEDNMQVANCTTPANYFHILRRQMHRPFRKPLIIMTPKSLLRHKRAVSNLVDMAEGSSFHRVLHDDAQTRPEVAGITIKADKDI
ncbi:MAG: 2-oxoglutarate dehydrogenase E1 component, partial [Caulobacteraceae bacterium]